MIYIHYSYLLIFDAVGRLGGCAFSFALCSCFALPFCATLKLNYHRRKEKKAKRREINQPPHTTFYVNCSKESNTIPVYQSINNMLPASRARAVRATLPVMNGNLGSAQSAQNGVWSAVESLKTLMKVW